MEDLRVRLTPQTGIKARFAANSATITLKNSVATTRLIELSDVQAAEVYKVNGSLLVYDGSNDFVLLDIMRYDRHKRAYVLDGGDEF